MSAGSSYWAMVPTDNGPFSPSIINRGTAVKCRILSGLISGIQVVETRSDSR